MNRKPRVVIGREKTGKVLVFAQAYLLHYAINLVEKNARLACINLTELYEHKRGKL